MKIFLSIFSVFIIGWSILTYANSNKCKTEEIKRKILKENELPSTLLIYKIEFEGHTYVYLVNRWSCAGNALLHDPACICLNKIKP